MALGKMAGWVKWNRVKWHWVKWNWVNCHVTKNNHFSLSDYFCGKLVLLSNTNADSLISYVYQEKEKCHQKMLIVLYAAIVKKTKHVFSFKFTVITHWIIIMPSYTDKIFTINLSAVDRGVSLTARWGGGVSLKNWSDNADRCYAQIGTSKERYLILPNIMSFNYRSNSSIPI